MKVVLEKFFRRMHQVEVDRFLSDAHNEWSPRMAQGDYIEIEGQEQLD